MRSNNRDETFDQWRQRMLDDTSRFIEWGLLHPEKLDAIPRHRVGMGSFSERMKNVFWSLVLHDPDLPD